MINKSKGITEIETNKINHLHQIDDLNFKIKYLNYDIIESKNEILLLKDSINKYYFSSSTIIQDTYFGDNQPLLFELYMYVFNLIWTFPKRVLC